MQKKRIAAGIAAVLMAFTSCAYAKNEIPVANPGTRTIRNLLATAVQPIGSTMYIWGGGHTPAGDSGIDAVTIGLGRYWSNFYAWQTADYNYEDFEYRYRDGLDCSGFVGWTLYNTLNSQSGGTGYVMKSTIMARTFASRGFGQYFKRSKITKLHAGDIMSTGGHVYMGIGECGDGSWVLVHSSPPCVQITGTVDPSFVEPEGLNETEKFVYDSEAVRLANYYMNKYWHELHAKYPDHSRGTSYLHDYDQMVWYINTKYMTDPDGYQSMDAYEVLKALFDDDGLILKKPTQKIVVNGVEILNKVYKYPFYSYNDILYFPLTYDDCHLLGFETEIGEDGNVSLSDYSGVEQYMPVIGDNGVLIGEPCDDITVNGEVISCDEAYPTVKSNNIIYIPLTWDVTQSLGLNMALKDDEIDITTAAKEDDAAEDEANLEIAEIAEEIME